MAEGATRDIREARDVIIWNYATWGEKYLYLHPKDLNRISHHNALGIRPLNLLSLQGHQQQLS